VPPAEPLPDTLEDAAPWTREERRAALAGFELLLQGGEGPQVSELARLWLERPPSENADYLRLLEHTPQLLASLEALRPEASSVVRRFVLLTSRGMREVLARATEQGVLTLASLEELRARFVRGGDTCDATRRNSSGLVKSRCVVPFVSGESSDTLLDPRLARSAARVSSGRCGCCHG
jgi:hypothetical protein